jgi:hypothetical protein
MRSQENPVHKMKLRERVAQSTFEYIILVAAVVAVVVAFASSPFFQQSVNKVIDDGIGQLARTTEGVDFDIPSESVDFFTAPPPPVNNGAPPNGWESPPLHCLGSTWHTTFYGLDENGFPIFTEQEVYNQCTELWERNGATPEDQPLGNLKFDENGTLMFHNASGNWEPFDWNNSGHLWFAYKRQRYGPYAGSGCGMFGHITDYAGYFENVFGRPGTCEELHDQYYGEVPLQGLTGDMAQYNGLSVYQAHYRKAIIEHMANPDSPSYAGTPQEPGYYFRGWGRAAWLYYYNMARRVGAPIPFTKADIDAAFPPEG